MKYYYLPVFKKNYDYFMTGYPSVRMFKKKYEYTICFIKLLILLMSGHYFLFTFAA